jgi:predicted Zn-dependent peptidase
MRRLLILLVMLGIGFIYTPTASSQDLDSIEKRVTEFTLDNGLHFIVIERHVAPVASFVSYVDVGAANEPIGETGIAHIFEHMAFKGTTSIGTSNWKAEKKALDKLDATYQKWLNEKYKAQPDTAKMAELWDQFKNYQEEAKQYVVNNEFSQIVDRNGGNGMNANTGADQTRYFYSLPSNRTELWFALESDRFINPVFREFYTEKEVVREERRMRTESNPQGRLIEEFTNVAYTAHTYGRPVVGWNADITSTTIADAKAFYSKYYVPSNITIAIAGDVDPAEMKQYAEKYFGNMPAGDPVPPLTIEEPEQRGERRFVIEENSQPFYLMGFHTVSATHPDAPALQLLGQILSSGRTSRLYKRMVDEEKSALGVFAFNGYPGDKYESLFMNFAIPNRGVSLDKIESTILEEIDKVKNGDVTQEELDRVITKERASLIRSLDSNMGLALSFAGNAATKGDWRYAFTRLDQLKNVTLDDIQRVANKYLIKSNRTVGMIKNKDAKEEDNGEVANAEK